eukprot:5924_1
MHRFQCQTTNMATQQTRLNRMARRMTTIRELIHAPSIIPPTDPNKTIQKVCLIVVVDAEIKPIMKKYKFATNKKLSAKFLNLGMVFSGNVNKLHIDVIQVAQSQVFARHYSGYTQSSALAALVSSIINPDIVINFGTAGGVTSNLNQSHAPFPSCHEDEEDTCKTKEKEEELNEPLCVEIGDVIFGEAYLFLDRLRTRSKNAFDWGLWGGRSLQADNMVKDLGLTKGIIGSQIGYIVTQFQTQMISNTNIIALDMESAPIAQILNQTRVNFFALKVISNGIYPENPEKMESEYHDNMDMVSKKATETLVNVIDYLSGKKICDLFLYFYFDAIIL